MKEPFHRRLGKEEYAIAAALALGTVLSLGIAQRSLGIPRDEGIYFHAAERYWGFFTEVGDTLSSAIGISNDSDDREAGKKRRLLSVPTITRYWNFNTEHPPLFKLLAAFSWRVFHKCECTTQSVSQRALRYHRPHRTLALLSEAAAFRLPTWLLSGLAVALIYLFGLRIGGRITGFSAALLFITIPRVFFHAQLFCFDMPITSLSLLVIYAYLRSLTSARWGILSGLFFGLAVAGKHNAWFLGLPLLIHYLVLVWPAKRSAYRSIESDHRSAPTWRRLPRIPLAALSMIIGAPLILYTLWPWLWFDTVKHFGAYLNFHLHYAYYNVEFLGKNYNAAPLPFSYPFVMMVFTVPTTLLVLAGLGTAFSLRSEDPKRPGERPRPTSKADAEQAAGAQATWLRPGLGLNPRWGLLLVLNAAMPLFLIAAPTTPISGGTKHFMTAYPYIALLAGLGLNHLVQRWMNTRPIWRFGWRRRALTCLLPLVVALPGATNAFLALPYGLSQYNAIAGGPAGGADLGLMRQFWGISPRGVLPWINATLEPDAAVYWHDVIGYSYGAYLRAGLLRPDIANTGLERPAIDRSTAAMVIHERHFSKYEYWIWQAYRLVKPAKVLTLGGVPLVTIYRRPH